MVGVDTVTSEHRRPTQPFELAFGDFGRKLTADRPEMLLRCASSLAQCKVHIVVKQRLLEEATNCRTGGGTNCNVIRYVRASLNHWVEETELEASKEPDKPTNATPNHAQDEFGSYVVCFIPSNALQLSGNGSVIGWTLTEALPSSGPHGLPRGAECPQSDVDEECLRRVAIYILCELVREEGNLFVVLKDGPQWDTEKQHSTTPRTDSLAVGAERFVQHHKGRRRCANGRRNVGNRIKELGSGLLRDRQCTSIQSAELWPEQQSKAETTRSNQQPWSTAVVDHISDSGGHKKK